MGLVLSSLAILGLGLIVSTAVGVGLSSWLDGGPAWSWDWSAWAEALVGSALVCVLGLGGCYALLGTPWGQ